MLDNQLIQLILGTINPQLVVAGIAGVPIAQAYQPTQQGVDSNPAAFLHKLGDKRLGYPYRANVWNENTLTEDLFVNQSYQTLFQISALATQDPSNLNQLTASDIINLIAYCLQSDETISTFAAAGAGILAINQTENPYFTDDRGRFEASPSLTFTMTHTQSVKASAPFTETVIFNINTI